MSIRKLNFESSKTLIFDMILSDYHLLKLMFGLIHVSGAVVGLTARLNAFAPEQKQVFIKVHQTLNNRFTNKLVLHYSWGFNANLHRQSSISLVSFHINEIFLPHSVGHFFDAQAAWRICAVWVWTSRPHLWHPLKGSIQPILLENVLHGIRLTHILSLIVKLA